MRNGVGEKFVKRSPGTNDTRKTEELLALRKSGSDKRTTMLVCKLRLVSPPDEFCLLLLLYNSGDLCHLV